MAAFGVVSGHEDEVVVPFDVVVFVKNARMARKLSGYDVMNFRVEFPPLPRRAEA